MLNKLLAFAEVLYRAPHILLDVATTADRIDNRVRMLVDRPPVRVELPPLVCVLVEAEALIDDPPGNSVQTVSFGRSVELGETPETITFTAQRLMRRARVTVFCDLRRVRVTGVYCGTEMQNGDLGDTPSVVVNRVWEPGVHLRVCCERREGR